MNALLELQKQMEIDFLKEYSYEQINDMFRELKTKLDKAESKVKNLGICSVTHRYFTLSEAKPENGKPCIVNNGADNYHIAFWDEEANGFVNQTGYPQKEFNRWLYLPINGG